MSASKIKFGSLQNFIMFTEQSEMRCVYVRMAPANTKINPFDYEQENSSVGDRVIAAAEGFDYSETEYAIDESPGRMAFFYHDPEQFYKHIKPVRKK